jgi:hypothetical protein
VETYPYYSLLKIRGPIILGSMSIGFLFIELH